MLFKEDRGRVRINRLTFYVFKEGRREREREEHRERIDLPFVFFKEERRRKREKKEEEEVERVSLPLFKGLEIDYPCDLQHP
jgi:hypothetical protein